LPIRPSGVRGFRGDGGNGYTLGMDSVRFGRVLGIGTRLAAKTVAAAVDAATSPNPSAGAKAKPSSGASPTQAAASASASAGGKAEASGVRLGQQAAQVRQTGKGLKEGSKRFGEAMWGPLAKASGALWLELTGVFFGIFAVFAGGGAWKMRTALHQTAANHDVHVRFLAAVLMAAVFGYFCVSSFVKANRRSRA
jgi:hypothetical protein